MGNMDYCKFENTLEDMGQCYEGIDDVAEMSNTERKAREKMIKLCIDIALDYGYVVDREIVDDG